MNPPTSTSDVRTTRRGERRLPMALAVVVAAGLFQLVPEAYRLGEFGHYGYTAILLVFLVVLIVADPGRIDSDRRWLRLTTSLMIMTMSIGAGVSVIRLVAGILRRASFIGPGQLLTIGAITWVTTVIAFAFWYWHLDRGGAAARARNDGTKPPAFHFAEENLPELVDPQWFPQYIDYFVLSFNTATAFGPTDVSAIRHWSKLLLVLESALSLTLIGLVVARAVNIL